MPKGQTDEVDFVQLAKQGLDRIVKLSQSQKISEKLQSFNILLVTVVFAFIITHFLIGSTGNGLTIGIFFIGSFIVALIISLGYGPVLSIVSNVCSNNVESLRASIMILFIALSLAIAALTLNLELLAIISLALIGLQLLTISLGGIILPKKSTEDKKVNANQLWNAIGRLSSIVGIISFAIDIILLILRIQ